MTNNFNSISEYYNRLSESLKKIDGFYPTMSLKKMNSFKVTMRNILLILDNMKEIQKMKQEMNKFPYLSILGKKENKSAMEASKLITSIKGDLNDSYERLKNEFFKQMDIANKQRSELGNSITDKDAKKQFYDSCAQFRTLWYVAKTKSDNLPFDKKDELAEYELERVRQQHSNEEREIDRNANFILDDSNKLEEALAILQSILSHTIPDKLTNAVATEVAQIKRVLPPKTILITQKALERLRNSSHLLLDLEQINEILHTTHRFTGRDGKMQKINKKLDTLQKKLQQAIEEEYERRTEIKREHSEIKSKVDYAATAVKKYAELIDENSRLEPEQISVKNRTHPLYETNEQLEQAAKEAVEKAKASDDDRIATELYKKASERRQMVTNNEAYLESIEKKEVVVVLPEKYTDMKKKLQGTSYLYQMSQETYNLSSEGKSK